MVINAYKTILNENKETNIKEKDFIVKEISNKLLRENLDMVEREEKEKLVNKIKDILIHDYGIISDDVSEEYTKAVLDKIYGYGIFEHYLCDNITTDIRVVAFNQVYVKQRGIWRKTDETFKNIEEFDEYIRFCALKNNCNINTENPIGIFSDRKKGLRIEAGIEPVNVSNSNLVIRIHDNNTSTTLEELLIVNKMFNKNAYRILKEITDQKKNVIVCGKGGSGKTTLLRAIINDLPDNIAITTNEETAELNIKGKNVIQRECIMSRNEDRNIDLRKLSKQALVMSSDVIVIGEIKGEEANAFFEAITSGHMGLATVHADSSINAIDRVITLIKKDIRAHQYTETFLKRLISSTLDYVVYMNDFTIKEIASLGFDEDKQCVRFKKIYRRE